MSVPEPRPAYAAAGNGRRLRYFPAFSFGPNAKPDALMTLVARSREAARNDPWAVALSAKSVANGIGCGIQARPRWGTKAQKAAQKKLWNRWMKRCNADGVLDFYGMQALGWREMKEAGEGFIRLRSRRPGDGLPVPMQIQLLESEQCPRTYCGTASNGNSIRQGIEFNGIGARVAYWMYREHPGDRTGNVSATELVRIPAEQIIHFYSPLRAGQLRGTPACAAVLVLMMNLQQLTDTKLENYKLGNLFSMFFVRDVAADGDGLGGESPLDEAVDGIDDDGTPIAGMEPGTAQELPPGVKPLFSTPPAPGADYAEYYRGLLMAIAASHGVPYEVLSGDLRDVSDRALRLILNEFRRAIEMDQWLTFIPQLCQGVREWFFDAAVLSGKLPISNYAEIRDDVIDTTWVPQGWPYSHPVQDVEADIKAIRAGLASRSGTNMSNGEDGEDIDAENVEDNKRADALGLKYDSDGRQAKSGGGAA